MLCCGMPVSLIKAANAFAWAVVICMAGVTFGAVVLLGPFGLILLGLLILFVCTSVDLGADTPTWSTAMFRAQIDQSSSPEQRAARLAERDHALAPWRLYRWYGAVLIVAGIAGFVLQQR
jgi:hypothetical protein